MAKSSETKKTQIKAPKTVKGASKVRITLIVIAAILAVVCFVAAIKAGITIDNVTEFYTQKIAESNASSSAQIQELTKQFNADRQAWIEKNMPEVPEEYLPMIEQAEKEKAAALKGVTSEKEKADISKRYDSKISTIQKTMDGKIDPVFNSESNISAKFKEDEAAIRSANSQNVKQLNIEEDQALLYPTHVSDVFTILTLIALGVVLWLLSGMLSNIGFLKGSAKLLEIVPFLVLFIEVCVVLMAITGLSFGDHMPAEFSKDFGKYCEQFKAVLF